MSWLSGIMGDATEADLDAVEKDLERILAENEKIERAYKLIRDLIVFSSHRLLLIDKQGITGKKTEYFSIPYPSISHFSVESKGHFDLEGELKIWLSHPGEPVTREFRDDDNIFEVQQSLATYAAGAH